MKSLAPQWLHAAVEVVSAVNKGPLWERSARDLSFPLVEQRQAWYTLSFHINILMLLFTLGAVRTPLTGYMLHSLAFKGIYLTLLFVLAQKLQRAAWTLVWEASRPDVQGVLSLGLKHAYCFKPARTWLPRGPFFIGKNNYDTNSNLLFLRGLRRCLA